MNRIFLISSIVLFVFFACNPDDGVEPDNTTTKTEEVTDTTSNAVDTNEVVQQDTLCENSWEEYNYCTFTAGGVDYRYVRSYDPLDKPQMVYDSTSFLEPYYLAMTFYPVCSDENHTSISVRISFDLTEGEPHDSNISLLFNSDSENERDYIKQNPDVNTVNVVTLDTVNNVISLNFSGSLIERDTQEPIAISNGIVTEFPYVIVDQ